MSDSVMRDGYLEFQGGMRDAYESARAAAAEIAQKYSAEMFAASGGDDVAERTGRAWLRFQRDMAKVSYDHFRAISERQRAWASVVEDVRSEAAEAAYKSYLDGLRSMGLTNSDDPPSSGDTPKSDATNRRGRSTQKKEPESSD